MVIRSVLICLRELKCNGFTQILPTCGGAFLGTTRFCTIYILLEHASRLILALAAALMTPAISTLPVPSGQKTPFPRHRGCRCRVNERVPPRLLEYPLMKMPNA